MKQRADPLTLAHMLWRASTTRQDFPGSWIPRSRYLQFFQLAELRT